MKYRFHDTELSGIVENAFHAVAIDEHRKNYESTLWAPKYKPNQRMEQVWFSGAHSDVGGGYKESKLSDITLRWMADRLGECALELDRDRLPGVGPENATAPVHDSYALFLKGAYQLVASRVFRPLGAMPHGNEALDDSVRQRLVQRDDYRPKNAVHGHLQVADADMEGITRLGDLSAGS